MRASTVPKIVVLNGCIGGSYVRGGLNGDETGLFKAERTDILGYQKDISFGPPAIGTYKYTIQKSDNGNFARFQASNFQERVTEIQWTNSPTPPTTGNPNAPTSTTKPTTTTPTTGTTGSTTPKPKPININTNVTATFNVNLDESIGYFFNPLDSSKALTLPQIITGIIRILFALIGIVAVVVIIVAGFRMVLAQGNETSLTKAKESITWAIIGLIVSLMAFSIVAILQRFIQFGAN